MMAMIMMTSQPSYYICPTVGLKLSEEVYAAANFKLEKVVTEYKLAVENDPTPTFC